MDFRRQAARFPSLTLIALIRGYQATLSPDHGILRHCFPYGYCRFHPSCSQYAVEAIAARGVFRGCFLSARRLLRCNPWNSGGFDRLE